VTSSHDIFALELLGLSKTFDPHSSHPVKAVDDVSVTVRKGEIFTIVGPDGAGKTTAIRMMCGVLPQDRGDVRIMGLDLRTQRDEVKRHIGYLSQRFSLYGDLTIDENIDFFAEIHRIKEFGARKEELLKFMRLTEFRDRLASRLSGGMKQKLELACTLIHAPDIIFLDEPTTGVDPVSRRDFWKILSELLRSGITIVVSTPYLDEAERSTRVALMDRGRILQCDSPEAIKADFPFRVLEIVTEDVRTAADVLSADFPKDRIQMFGDRIHCLIEAETDASRKAVERRLKGSGVVVHHIRPVPPSLEDVFIARVSTAGVS